MGNTRFFKTDCESVFCQIKHQEKQLQLKRRWLLGLPISKSDRKQFERPGYLEKRSLPESFLRDDDIFYETVKSYVEEAFGECHVEQGNQDVQHDVPNMSRVILSCLNDFTNKGLYLVAMLLTGGEIKFEKTRWNMTKVIRESLPKVFGSQNHTHQEMKVSSQLSQLLNDPQNFRDNYVPFLTKSQVQHAAAAKILDGLRDLPSQTLIAMHRKLKGMQQSMPQLQPSRNGWSRDYLIKQVRKTSKQLLSELGTEDQLQEPLAKAMAIAALSLKLMPGFHNSSLEEFYQFSPDIEMLQKQITKAICLIRTTFRTADLKKFQLLLDPKAKVSIRCLRTAIKKMLTEYLFECSDMVSIPESLLETLDIINGNSRITPNGCTLQDEIEEEVECILNVSAHAKQIVGDLLVDHDFDIDFTDAYMEDLEESDDDYGYCDGDIDNDRINDDDDDDEYDDNNGLQGDRISQNSSTGSLDPNREVASTGDSESIFIDGHGTRCSTMVDSVDIPDSRRVMSDKFIETRGPVYQGMGPESLEHQWNGNQALEKGVNHDHISHKNQYLAIQEVCDETSMATHKIIGHMLGAFARIQDLDLLWYDRLYLKGDYVEEDSEVANGQRASPAKNDNQAILQIVEQLLPSFPQGGNKKLRKLMAS